MLTYFAVHGFGLTTAMWHPVRSQLKARFIAPVVPGHHEPVANFDAAVETLSRQAPEDSIWLGYSLGGRLAASAVAAGANAKALVVISSHLGLDEVARAERLTWDRRVAQRMTQHPEDFWQWWERLPALRTYSVDAEAAERWNEQRISYDPRELAATFLALGQGAMPSCEDNLRARRIPTLFILGELDAKYRTLCERYAQWADIAVLAHCGHSVVLEKPTEVAKTIEEWVDATIRHGRTRR